MDFSTYPRWAPQPARDFRHGAPRTTHWRSPRKFIVKARIFPRGMWGSFHQSHWVYWGNCELIRVAASQVGYMVHQYLVQLSYIMIKGGGLVYAFMCFSSPLWYIPTLDIPRPRQNMSLKTSTSRISPTITIPEAFANAAIHWEMLKIPLKKTLVP